MFEHIAWHMAEKGREMAHSTQQRAKRGTQQDQSTNHGARATPAMRDASQIHLVG